MMSWDSLIAGMDKALRTLFVSAPASRPVPGREMDEADLNSDERRHAGALMRINHVGEVCAQALYQGQSMACLDPDIRATLNKAADEETEHLAWTERRIAELGSNKSLLNPFWYSGAFLMGVVAGKFGDEWSLGFLAETERQVEAHLAGHLDQLPERDAKSRAIVGQMKIDEKGHADIAVALGARSMPVPVRYAMRLIASVMIKTAYRL